MAHGRIYGPATYPYLFYKGAPIVDATVTIGDITVDPPASGTLTIDTVETIATTTINISAGAYRVHIKNVGALQEGGDPVADITVNGDTVPVGEEVIFTAVLDPALGASGTFKTLPAITITNASGAGIWYQVTS